MVTAADLPDRAHAHVLCESAPTAMLVGRPHRRLHLVHGGDYRRTIKRVVAYSTLSQLGYMAMGAGVGASSRPSSTSSPTPSSRVVSSWRRRHPRYARGAEHPAHGWATALDAGDILDVPRRLIRQRGHDPFAGFWSKDEIILGAWVTDLIPITDRRFWPSSGW